MAEKTEAVFAALVRANALAANNWARSFYSAGSGVLSLTCWPIMTEPELPNHHIKPARLTTPTAALFFRNPCFLRLPYILGRVIFRVGTLRDVEPLVISEEAAQKAVVVVLKGDAGVVGCIVCENALFLQRNG